MSYTSKDIIDFTNSDIYKRTVMPTEVRKQIAEKSSDYRIDTAFYSAGFLIEKLEAGIIEIDPVKSACLQSQAKCSLIESILLGLPSAQLYFKVTKHSTYLTLSGSSIIWTLYKFVMGKFALIGMRKLHRIEGMKFSDLPLSQRNYVLSAQFQAKVFSGYFDRDMVTILEHSISNF